MTELLSFGKELKLTFFEIFEFLILLSRWRCSNESFHSSEYLLSQIAYLLLITSLPKFSHFMLTGKHLG